jgi:hypothetical protein
MKYRVFKPQNLVVFKACDGLQARLVFVSDQRVLTEKQSQRCNAQHG